MTEYIEREAAIKAIYDSEPFGVHKYFWWRAMDIEEALRAIPAVDVAPVVRCKDCAYTREKDEYESVYLCDECVICTHSEGGWRPVWPTHFCGYGERKEND